MAGRGNGSAGRNGCVNLLPGYPFLRMGLGLENPLHLLIIAVIVLLVFGPKRLPEAGKSLGKGIRQFRDAITGGDDDEDEKRPQVTPAAEAPAAPEADAAPEPAASSPERETTKSP